MVKEKKVECYVDKELQGVTNLQGVYTNRTDVAPII